MKMSQNLNGFLLIFTILMVEKIELVYCEKNQINNCIYSVFVDSEVNFTKMERKKNEILIDMKKNYCLKYKLNLFCI